MLDYTVIVEAACWTTLLLWRQRVGLHCYSGGSVLDYAAIVEAACWTTLL